MVISFVSKSVIGRDRPRSWQKPRIWFHKCERRAITGRWAKWETMKLPSSSVPAKTVNQKNYRHPLRGTTEISATTKNLEDAELVLPIIRLAALALVKPN